MLLDPTALRPGHAEAAVRDLVAACSPGCLRDRFFGRVADPVALLTAQVRDAIWEGAAFGAFADEAVVALGVALPDGTGTTWELGVLVSDEWQGRGVGDLLLHRLVGEAARAGVAPVAVVEAANARALALVRRARRSPAGATLRVEVW